jgi:hypothetical protein
VCYAKSYTGPAKPTIPSDTAAIKTAMADCMNATEEAFGVTVADGGDAVEIKKSATALCALREQHKAARDRLLSGLAKLVTFFKDQTNHDHAANLPATIKAVQNVVGECLNALRSQQYCHNVGCNEEPERNFDAFAAMRLGVCSECAPSILEGFIQAIADEKNLG